MPTGVEHYARLRDNTQTDLVQPTSMPTGVEHVVRLSNTSTTTARATNLDADRR